MSRYFPVAALVLWALAVGSAQAGCSRSDVEFYLKQGFANDQVVKLCASGPAAAPARSRSYDERGRGEPRNYASRAEEEDEIFLRTAIDGYDLSVTEDALAFTRKICVNFGWKDWNGFREEACPHVRYSVALKGLQVSDTAKEFYFFGAGRISVTGDIKREILNISEFPAKYHQQIRDAVASDDKTLQIGIRSGMPIYKVEGMLRSLAS